MGKKSEPFEVGEGTCIRDTPNALLIQFEDGREIWFPKSVIHEDSEVYEEEGSGTVIIYEWFAVEKGLA